ncbi:dTDP-4-dehydrorhamnose reductase [Catalinimonas alkaloidigena]|uniref:dTDP-4-dehydrorhamnose reductase n=1 Tax=Catalinimonas alkaloidigena TaxID=1075417 RepID=A0A1G9UQC4_9BACT|nr:SDR family oxidoreductase [Catalinimonas alkaloidigena]SDM62060.1 dTDP-4-dehydrorhamnose reductase [Catalinimonas alkaloidigena]
MKKVLITGANGLLGQKLVRLLSETGNYHTIATSRGESRLSEALPRVTYQALDITDRTAVLALFDEQQPDYVVNTAAMTNVDQCESDREGCIALNVDAVAYLIEGCQKHNAFLLHLSTDFIFDGEAGPYDETATPNPLSFYGQSKWDAEKLVEASGLRWAIGRTVLVYGLVPQMSRSNIVLWVKKSLEDGKDIHVVDDQWRTPTLAEDLAQGCELILRHDATGIFHLSGDELMTPYELALRTARAFGLNEALIHQTDGSRFTQPAKRPPRTGFILDKAKSQLAYRPHSFEAGLHLLEQQLTGKAVI